MLVRYIQFGPCFCREAETDLADCPECSETLKCSRTLSAECTYAFSMLTQWAIAGSAVSHSKSDRRERHQRPSLFNR